MKIMSLNIRGLGSQDKIKWVRELCVSESLDVVGLQESKMEVVNENSLSWMWGSEKNFGYAKVDAIGRSGGLICGIAKCFTILVQWERKGCWQ